jgi:hypothetical protein
MVEWGRLAGLMVDSDVVVGEVLDEESWSCATAWGVAEEADLHWTPYLRGDATSES